ncbi:hexapeptide transferase [Myroides odoratimimus]|uniref:sugar-transfer associated ATP-grasp domain-containing protein n=1 Tax=Myroides odoratimimus TaxID=76832 RepID=UPI002578CB67|nr:sugar-transfer associated ATP-grasp domain-containing protein [Myroides odoratimimus]MDM1517661.1 hexapeptide transferase [Myroides odoratimimus]MDM1527393.1 hexapeptide transferase [Myroides odoratimimus]
MIKNILYIPYYIFKTPRKAFFENVDYLSEKSLKSKILILIDVVYCSIVYSLSFNDYFMLRFFSKDKMERKEYAGTGFMYEYQLMMNPKKSRFVLEDKIEFLNYFSSYHGRRWYSINDFKEKREEIESLLFNTAKIVLKNSKGQAGKEVEVVDCMQINELEDYMRQKGYNLIEEFVVQHDKIQELAPRGLNTIRIITQRTNNNTIDILGAILRLSIESNTDNLSVGNAAVHIDLLSGKVDRAAVYGDFRKENIEIHPISNVSIVGFEIPFWQECLTIVKHAALEAKENKSIGWDVAITNEGPILIEGNHNWGRVLWQLPVNKGLKYKLEKYI